MTNSPEIDKQQHYGRYLEPMQQRVNVQSDRLRWQNQLAKQVTHKALDEPLLEEDPMHVDARRNTTVTNAGLGWKELLLIAGLGLPVVGGAGLAGVGIGWTLLRQHLSPAESATEDDNAPATQPDTRTIPRLRFGPERE